MDDILSADAYAALTWLETARISPPLAAAPLLEQVKRIDAAFEDDARVGISACATLLAMASRRPIDTPPVGDPLTESALAIAERLTKAALPDDLSPYAKIHLANALRLGGRARDDEAAEAYGAAISARPDDAAFRFDEGLFHKSRGRWSEAYAAFERARERGMADKPLHFNLAVAATALGRGRDAQAAWAALGIAVGMSDAGMPLSPGLSPVELRVPTRGSGHEEVAEVPDQAMIFEVVSVAPLSPCHGVVQTPTLRDAPVDYGDVVLWDGVPVGRREVDGVVTPRFALLEILHRGQERRFRFVGLEQHDGDTMRLETALPEGVRLFVLDARVESVCPRCAAGDAMRKHDHAPAEDHRIVRGKLTIDEGVPVAKVARALERALGSDGAVSLAVPELYEALDDTKRAGREHQAYRGIEQVARRSGLAGGR